MIRAFVKTDTDELKVHETLEGLSHESVHWIDLHEPSMDERALAADFLGVDLPSRAHMQEIESSSRLYRDEEVLRVTATIISQADTEKPITAPITFMLTQDCLITIRYSDPMPFRTYFEHISRHPALCASGRTAFAGLIEAIIDRMADLLEVVGTGMDRLSHEVFAPPSKKPRSRDFEEVLVRIGRFGDLTSRVRESLLSLSRIMIFLDSAVRATEDESMQKRADTINLDLKSLGDHSMFLSSKINFMLDATLGMISIEQSSIIKIFSVAAVVFLPPTLIASIYGMNFQFMPELDWRIGYPLALLFMVVSAILPYYYFKRRGWL
ncbi:MAG: magnesium transporter CorA family protein [Pseudomonadota bacterium]